MQLVARHQERDAALVSLPRSEVSVVARFGPSARDGLDLYAFGAQAQVRRKVIRAGQRTVFARLPLGTSVGVPAAQLAGRIVVLDELWGDRAVRRLRDQLAAAPANATALIAAAIAEHAGPPCVQLALEAAQRLAHAPVKIVAAELGVSDRQLRRVFRHALGVSPKAFAKLARFQRAVRAARQADRPSWARIAIATGYYDQSHLIDEFRAIAGVTPPTLLAELAASPR